MWQGLFRSGHDLQGAVAGYPTDRPRNWSLAAIFLVLFVPSLLISLGYTFVRQPLYRSTATILVAPPAAFDDSSVEKKSQYLAVQGQFLLSNQLLTALWGSIEDRDYLRDIDDLSEAQQLLRYLRVEQLPENMLQLHAEGKRAELLQPLASAWLDIYLQEQSAGIAGQAEATLAALEGEANKLSRHLTEKRRELQEYAEQHHITSRIREENEVLSQLKGLSTSLASASGDVISAEAHLHSLLDAADRGALTAGGEHSRELARMQGEAARLKGQLSAIAQRFTLSYMNKDPAIVALQDQYQLLTESIAEMKTVAHREAIAEADKQVQEARQLKAGLEQQLQQSNQAIREFSGHFGRYEELLRELQRLEEMANLTRERLVAERVGSGNRAPHITVLDRPRLPAQPFYPSYSRDSLISLAGSLLIALLGSGLHLLSRRREVLVWSGSAYQAGFGYLPAMRQQPELLEVNARQAIAHAPSARLAQLAGGQPEPAAGPEVIKFERTPLEIRELLDVAEPSTRLLIVFLLAGVRPIELPALCRADVDIANATLSLAGRHPRTIKLPANANGLLAQQLQPLSAEDRLWLDENGAAANAAGLDSLLHCAAVDAGLSEAHTVTAEALFMTYLVYLVRQGLRLGELQRLVGQLNSATLELMTGYSPQGKGLTLEQINPVYPGT